MSILLRFDFLAVLQFCLCLFCPAVADAGSLQDRTAETLRTAASDGNLAEVKACIDARIDVNEASRYGVTALALACDHGHTEIVEALLSAGANPNVKDTFYGFTPISWALMRKSPRIVELLLAKGVEDVDSGLAMAIGTQSEELIIPFLNTKKVSAKGLANAYLTAKRFNNEKLIQAIEPFLNEEAKELAEKTESENKKSASSDSPSPAASTATAEKEALNPRLILTPDFPLSDSNWPQFRGVLSRGISEKAKLPTSWNAEENKNIAWKTPIPGLATSSPICWEDRVIVTTADQEGDKAGFRTGAYGDVDSVKGDGICSYQVICLERATGKILWQKECVREVPKVKRHLKASHANPTPATDGRVVVASFAGAGIYCLDLITGELIWKKDLGKLDSGWFYDKSYQWGFGSSPFIFESTVILQCDHQDGAFITALDLKTGQEKWRTIRDDIPTWSSPVAFVAEDGTPIVVVAGTKASAGYNARTGEELWRLGGFSEIVVPTPQITRDLIMLTSGYRPIMPIVTLSHKARGELQMPKDKELSEPFFWTAMRGGPYMPTPLIRKDRLYVLDNSGIVSCYKLESGERLFRQRLRGEKASAFTASVIANDEHMFCTSEEGSTFVVAFDDEGTVVSQNQIDESVMATPAISGDMLLI
ncbi:MAG: PQQ-binding-like beta-propeller repeat protein, partial [Pirellula sp.]|nr:PQQ-binding-like beta-propeller repeat protein [Pirellula sp.]